MEEWKEVPGFPMYRVSSQGNVESKLSGSWVPRKLKRVNKGDGRIYLGFNAKLEERLPSGRCKTKTLLVHTLVAALFIGPRPAGMKTLHRDDNRDHNAVENLYYGDMRQNVADAIRNGKMNPIRGPGGRFVGSECGHT